MTQDLLGYLFILWAFIGVSVFVVKNLKELKSKNIHTSIIMSSKVTVFWAKIIMATILICTAQ